MRKQNKTKKSISYIIEHDMMLKELRTTVTIIGFVTHLLMRSFIANGIWNRFTTFSMIPKQISAVTETYISIIIAAVAPLGLYDVRGLAIPRRLDTTYRNPFLKSASSSTSASKPPNIDASRNGFL